MQIWVQNLLKGCLLAALVACSAIHEPGYEDPNSKPTVPISKLLEAPETITFDTVKAYVLQDACLRCHSGDRLEGRVDLSTLEAVLSTDPRRRGSVVPSDPERSPMFTTLNAKGRLQMPPAGQRPLSDEQKDLIYFWILNGAIGEVGQVPVKAKTIKEELAPFIENPATIDFAVINKHVLNTSCNECHSENGSKPDEDAILYGDFTNFDTFMDPFTELVTPGRPSKSEIFQSVATQSMPPAKDGYDPLNAWRTKLLRLWILNCAVETVPEKGADNLVENPQGKDKVRICQTPVEPPPPGGGAPVTIEEVLEKPERIVFETVKSFVLDSNCIDCHGGDKTKANVDVASYKALITPGPTGKLSLVPFDPDRSPLYNTLDATGDRHMPPLDEPQLSEDQKKLIYVWIDNGAKEKLGDVVDPNPGLKEQLAPYFKKPETVDYLAVNKYVFSDNCNDCHSEAGSKSDEEAILYGADLTSFDTIVNNPFLEVLKKGKPNKSDLFQSVALQEMPAASDGYEPVDALKVKLLRLWILNCAIEDYAKIENDHLFPEPKDLEKIRDCSPRKIPENEEQGRAFPAPAAVPKEEGVGGNRTATVVDEFLGTSLISVNSQDFVTER